MSNAVLRNLVKVVKAIVGDIRMDIQMDGRTYGWMYRCMDGLMDGRTDGWTYILTDV